MKNYRAAVAGMIAVASLTLVGCGSDREVGYRDTQIEELNRVNKELEKQLQDCIDSQSHSWIASHPDAGQVPTARAVLPGVTINTRPVELVLTIENNVLFRPGSSELSGKARTVLLRVISLLKEKYAEGYYVRVDGHTDNQKIRLSKDKWKDNWDLSGGRSEKVLHFLLEHGVPAKELGFAGYGEERPLDSNSTEAGRAKNRRVDIVVIPKNPGESAEPPPAFENPAPGDQSGASPEK